MRLATLLRITAGAAGALALSSAFAAPIVLNFAGLLGDQEEKPLDYYNGGTGSLGSGPGTNYGVSFGSDALACSGMPGGACNTSAIPGGTGANVLFFLTGAGDVMNVAAGFTTGFSFYYSAVNQPGFVDVYSGLNSTGTLLSHLVLPVTASTPGSNGCYSSGAFCPYVATGVSFDGTARSVNFSGTANQIGFALITIGSATAGGGGTTAVPEPETVALFALGGLAAFAARRRRRA